MFAWFGKRPTHFLETAFWGFGIVFVLSLTNPPEALSQKRPGEKLTQINVEGKFPKDINPHDQINDEGELDEQVCILCHQSVPSRDAEDIEDVTFLFEKFKDLKEMCFTCHPERMHPGGGTFATADPRWKKWGAPNHWVRPTEIVEEKMDSMLSEMEIILPLDPKTEEITCVTCHNPHELGVLRGAANVGADGNLRLRKLNAPICLMCHDL
ncbi:MAG: hypothetical protein ACE5FU_03695 [Nitrospinota bacterium]